MLAWMHTHTHTHMHKHIHTNTHMYKYKCIYMKTHAHTKSNKPYTHIHMYTHTHHTTHTWHSHMKTWSKRQINILLKKKNAHHNHSLSGACHQPDVWTCADPWRVVPAAGWGSSWHWRPSDLLPWLVCNSPFGTGLSFGCKFITCASCGGVPQTQKSKSPFLRASKVPIFKPEVVQNVALHAKSSARNSAFLVHST